MSRSIEHVLKNIAFLQREKLATMCQNLTKSDGKVHIEQLAEFSATAKHHNFTLGRDDECPFLQTAYLLTEHSLLCLLQQHVSTIRANNDLIDAML